MPNSTATASRSPAPKRLQQRWRRGDAEQRRELIVDTALDLLHKRGLDAVTIRQVAGRLGVGAMTLYTYIDGQHGLRREMVRRGFAMLNEHCDRHSTLDTAAGWRGGARAYVRFAMERPNLYKLMFDVPMAADEIDLLEGGFSQLLVKVKARLEAQRLTDEQLERHTRVQAGRFWIALHGLATLAVAGRLGVLVGDIDTLLDDLLPRVAPD